jgi:integrin alpha FG-GAP repeat containing protein 1
VVNVIPADFTHSGKLDLLVMSEGLTGGTLEMHVYQSLASGGFGEYQVVSLSGSNAFV